MILSDTSEQRFIPLLSDYGFKVTFGNEGNTLFLRRALQALIQSEVPITQVEFLPNEINRLSKDSRGGIYNLAVLRNQTGELIDDQTTFVTVELAKFTKPLADISSDLDKLLYTMKTLHTVTNPIQYPAFWNEEWLQVAINELDRLNLSPEELLVYEMTLSANALTVRNEERKIREAELRVKEEAIGKGLRAELAVELIAELNGVSVEFVRKIQQQLNAELGFE